MRETPTPVAIATVAAMTQAERKYRLNTPAKANAAAVCPEGNEPDLKARPMI